MEPLIKAAFPCGWPLEGHAARQIAASSILHSVTVFHCGCNTPNKSCRCVEESKHAYKVTHFPEIGQIHFYISTV